MKLTLSKRGDPRGRHLVVVTNLAEQKDIYALLMSEVTEGRTIAREVDRRRDQVHMRFHLRYLEKLMLTIPFSTLSTGVEKLLFVAEKERLDAMPVPDIFVPGMEGELWGYQKIMAEKLANSDETEMWLDNDEMGLGKTRTILAALAMREWFPALIVVGSLAGKYVWERECADVFPKISLQVVDGTPAQRLRQIRSGAQITVVNCQALRIKRYAQKDDAGKMIYEDGQHVMVEEVLNPELFEQDWEALVVDEYHKFKNPSAQQTVGFLKMECGRFLGASGTPIMSCPEEAWPFLHKCDPETFPTYYHFENQIGKFSKTGKKLGYDPNEMLKVKQWLAKHSLRRRKEHVSSDLPEVLRSERMVALTAEQRRIYNRVRDEMLIELDGGETKDIGWVRVQIMRLKQACFSPELFDGSAHSGKIDQIKEDVAQLVASGEKAIIFSEWSTAARILERELAQYNPAYVDGSVKGRMRTAQEDRFNHDPECKLYIGTIKANQEAITLDAATYVLFADEEWTPKANEQAEARSAGGGMRGLAIGAGGVVNYVRYQAEDTIEQRLAEKLFRKSKIFNTMIERDGGASMKKLTIRNIRDLI